MITIHNLIYLIIGIVILMAIISGLEKIDFLEIIRIKDEKLVGIIRINFTVSHSTYAGGDYDEVAINHSVSTHFADVYCYENEVGKRKLNINAYAYNGSDSFIKNTIDYPKLLDWKSGRSNLYAMPSYSQVFNGMPIVEKKD